MGGSGGGSGGHDYLKPSEAEETNKILKREFEEELSVIISERLAIINSRDEELCRARIEELKQKLDELFDDAIKMHFAGSVKKHTYVEGTSDIDLILQIKNLPDEAQSPSEVLSSVANQIEGALSDEVRVDVGKLAVTLTYSDGNQLQIVPGLKSSDTSSDLKIPSAKSSENWSNINPKKFTDALTRRNQQCDGKLIPTIKLAKLVIHNSGHEDKISGYHVESLAVDIFRGYNGSKKTTDMLQHFFEESPKAVLSPIKDKSGQSVNVDGYLGRQNSAERKDLSHILKGMSKRMKGASITQQTSVWEGFLKVPET